MDKIKVLLLLHMHQPVYRIKTEGRNVYYMPWVYLHGIREYYDIPKIIDKMTDIKVVINFVPTLLEQLEDYISGDFEDRFLEHYRKNAQDLSKEEVVFILDNFFSINYHSKLKHSKRYKYLLDKRGSPYDLEKKVARFTTQEIRDLQFLFYLYNTSVMAEEEYPFIAEMKKKDLGFTEDEKRRLLSVHRNILTGILPLYKKLIKEKKIEITFTPYSHPISPLLVNSECAEKSNPYTRLPGLRWRFPDNAEKQLKKGKEYVEDLLEEDILGMWPAEGAVSEAFLDIARNAGVKWSATDEGILEKSLGYVLRSENFPSEIYRVYDFKGLKMFFRDRELSDNLGFDLYKLYVDNAVELFIDKLNRIAVHGGDVVSIILDGENPWENYENGGVPFLLRLFENIESSGEIEFVTGRMLLYSEVSSLKKVYPGSWIRSDFTTWVGHPEKNRAWKYLVRVKEDTILDVKKNVDAEKALMYAEGSDWFWWYGDDNPTYYKNTFDSLFRMHLKEVYRLLNRDYPGFLDIPVVSEINKGYVVQDESAYITPEIDGKVSNFFEWLGAGVVDLMTGTGGVMKRQKNTLSRFLFGRDVENFYLRLEGPDELKNLKAIFKLEFYDGKGGKILQVTDENNGNCKKDKVFECKILLSKVIDKNNIVRVSISLIKEGIVEEKYPVNGFYVIKLITPQQLDEEWIV